MSEAPIPNQTLEAKKVNINMLFTDFWFRVPAYQRSYVWGEEQVTDLLDDLLDALKENPNKEYFLGSLVLQKFQATENGLTFPCYDILDGQQRLTTLFLLLAVLRDLGIDELLTDNIKNAIYQEEDPYRGLPRRIRIEFLIRDKVEGFIEAHIKKKGGTRNAKGLIEAQKSESISIAQMASNTIFIKELLQQKDKALLKNFAIFLFNKVNFIYVSAGTLDDAFKLFTILNSRGIPLTTSDILKSINIGEIKEESSRKKYAQAWEELESRYGREKFDRFLGYVRSIVSKEKARENLLEEFEKIYKQGKLKKGVETLQLIAACEKTHKKYLQQKPFLYKDSYQLSNLLIIMDQGIKSKEWVAPFLAYYHKFQDKNLLAFVERLESKFFANILLRLTPTQKRSSMYAILKAIERSKTSTELLAQKSVFFYDKKFVAKRLNDSVYSAGFCRYLLLKIEFILKDPSESFPPFNNITIEHVLPKKPRKHSQWIKDFTQNQAYYWRNRLANLVLLSRRKNTRLANKDFVDKKKEYFQSSINTFPNVNRIFQYRQWTPLTLEKRQKKLIELLMERFK